MNVLLLDNDTPKALDLVRHLGRQGVVVDILSRPWSVAFLSRYCHSAIPRRAATVPGMVEEALGILSGYDAVFVLVDDAVEALHRNRRRLPVHIERHLTSADTLEVTFSKVRMNALAHHLGIPVPATLPLDSEGDLDDFTREYGFPLLVKGEQGSAGSTIRMACSYDEIVTASQEVKEWERSYGGRPFVQEYVSGPVYSVSGLCREGTLLRVCIHRREAAYPLFGSPVMGVTVEAPTLLTYGEKIFQALRWNGLANLEFTNDPRTGEFKFLEINPRPWSSLELAHRAGVDMAGACCAMVTGTELIPDLTFRTGVRLVKLLPDGLFYLWAHPREIPRVVSRLVSRRCSTTVARDDLRPNLYQLKRAYWELLKDLRDGSVRADRTEQERLAAAVRTRSGAGQDFLLSVVVPTRNRRERLRNCLQSLRSADVPSRWTVEVIVVDNGSTDRTVSLVASFCQNGATPQFHYMSEPRVGKSCAVNTGIRSVRGSLLAFIDDDVVVDRRWISEIIEEFRRDPDLGILAGRVERADPDRPAVAITRVHTRIPLDTARSLEGLALGCNLVVRREVLCQVPGLDTRLGPGRGLACNDIDFIYRVLRAGFKGSFSPHPVVYHNPGPRDRTREYLRGWGAFYLKFLLRGDRDVVRQAWWRICRMLREFPTDGFEGCPSLVEEVWHLLVGAGVMAARMVTSLFSSHQRRQGSVARGLGMICCPGYQIMPHHTTAAEAHSPAGTEVLPVTRGERELR